MLFWPALLSLLGRAGAAVGLRAITGEAAGAVAKSVLGKRLAATAPVAGTDAISLRGMLHSTFSKAGKQSSDIVQSLLAKKTVKPGESRPFIPPGVKAREMFPQEFPALDRKGNLRPEAKSPATPAASPGRGKSGSGPEPVPSPARVGQSVVPPSAPTPPAPRIKMADLIPPSPIQQQTIKPEKHMDYGALMAHMGNPNAMGDAKADARIEAITDAAQQAKIKREQDAAKASHELQESMLRLTKRVSAVSGAMLGWYIGVKKVGDLAVAREGKIAPYSSLIMREMSRLNVQSLRNDVITARDTGRSSSTMLRTIYDFRETIRPIENTVRNVMNYGAAAAIKMTEYGIKYTLPGAFPVPWAIYKGLNWAFGKNPDAAKLEITDVFNELVSGLRRRSHTPFHQNGGVLAPPPDWKRNHF